MKSNYFYEDDNGGMIFSSEPLTGYTEITEEEYIQGVTPTEEEIRAAKEAQLRALLAELYPEGEVADGNTES